MLVLLRGYVSNDAAGVWAVLEPVFRAGDTYTIDPDISRFDAVDYWTAHETFVVEHEGRIVGTYYLRPNQQGGGSHVCNCGYVTHPLARGQGVARAMLEHSLETARALGYRAMQYNFVVSNNTRAVATWQNYGFEIVGRLPDAFLHPVDGYVDAFVMYRRLTG